MSLPQIQVQGYAASAAAWRGFMLSVRSSTACTVWMCAVDLGHFFFAFAHADACFRDSDSHPDVLEAGGTRIDSQFDNHGLGQGRMKAPQTETVARDLARFGRGADSFPTTFHVGNTASNPFWQSKIFPCLEHLTAGSRALSKKMACDGI
jgi:hypothetical protein